MTTFWYHQVIIAYVWFITRKANWDRYWLLMRYTWIPQLAIVMQWILLPPCCWSYSRRTKDPHSCRYQINRKLFHSNRVLATVYRGLICIIEHYFPANYFDEHLTGTLIIWFWSNSPYTLLTILLWLQEQGPIRYFFRTSSWITFVPTPRICSMGQSCVR